MTFQGKSQLEIIVEKLDRELMARGVKIPGGIPFEFAHDAGTPQRNAVMAQVKEYYDSTAPPTLDNALGHISTRDLLKILKVKIRELNRARGIWGEDSRKDYHEITGEPIKKNAHATAAICSKNNLEDTGNGDLTLKVKNYGTAFNLCKCEPFHQQPVAAGRLCSGFLVDKDIIATAGHCANGQNVTQLRFVFGYHMPDSSTTRTAISKQDIYNGVKLIGSSYDRMGNQSDWALVKLDRGVEGRPIVKLSKTEISPDRPVYIIGYPLGLPLKYSPGATVSEISETCFSADLNVYCGSSGSPVFDSKTHEAVGIVVRGDNRDFRLVENCWMSIIYSRANKCSKEPQCTRVSQFIDYL